MPASIVHTLRDSRLLCSVTLAGTSLITGAIIFLLLISLGIRIADITLFSLAVCAAAIVYIGIIYYLLKRGYCKASSYMLVVFYFVLSFAIVWTWGINIPIGPLLFGLVVVLAGILLKARDALAAAMLSGGLLLVIQTFVSVGWHTPNTSWASHASCYGDVLAYCIIFAMLAIVSWLYSREMEHSLAQAKTAKDALLQQKAILESKVKERTEGLRQAQHTEMQQMYRFAELGQAGVTLLHDLANNLSVLTLEIEGIESKQHAEELARAREVIRYLEDIVNSTRDRLHGGTQIQTFNMIYNISEVISFLSYKARKNNVTLEWQPPVHALQYEGDVARFCQVVAYIISNAIDAYANTTAPHRIVKTELETTSEAIVIKVSDWGKGIPKDERKNIFKPFQSTKKTGLGLGLFISRQIINTNFSGNLMLNPKSNHTEFIIKLPRKPNVNGEKT